VGRRAGGGRMIGLAVALVCLLVAVAAVVVGLYRWTR
jgi:hypothetical protein